MNVKAMIERKNELMAEARSMLKTAEVEKRGLGDTEVSRQAELTAEIEQLNTDIADAEKRAIEKAAVENIDSEKEKRKMENKITRDVEVRGLEQYLRKQNGEELRLLNVGTTADNGATWANVAGAPAGSQPAGMTMPTTLYGEVIAKLSEYAPLFARTKQFTPVNGTLEILREQTIGSAGFVGEYVNLSTSDVTFNKVTLSQKRVGTAIELTQQLINDSGINIVEYVLNAMSRRLGITIDQIILTGDKTIGQFEGVLNDPGNTIVGVTSAATTTFTIDDLMDLRNSLHPGYQAGAVFVVSRAIFNIIAKMKDANGQFYLTRDVIESGPVYKLFGQEIIISDGMPTSTATGSKIVLFANFNEGYATMVKKGLNLQHVSGDSTTALRGTQMFVLDGYMDGKFLNQDAMKILKMK